MIYFIMEQGNGNYVEADDYNDPLWNPTTCIEVVQKPKGMGYIYNIQSSEWELTIESQQTYIRPIRDVELARTDKFVLEDYPITPEHKAGALVYRQQLRDVPDKPTPQEMVMPECPPYLKP